MKKTLNYILNVLFFFVALFFMVLVISHAIHTFDFEKGMFVDYNVIESKERQKEYESKCLEYSIEESIEESKKVEYEEKQKESREAVQRAYNKSRKQEYKEKHKND